MTTTILRLLVILLTLTTGLWAQTFSDRADLKKWQYRWGDSPKDATGFLYLTKDKAGWQLLSLPGYPDNRGNNTYLWIRTRLKKNLWKNPTLYIPTIYHNFEVYLGTKRIYKFGSLAIDKPKEFLGLPWHIIALEKKLLRANAKHKNLF